MYDRPAPSDFDDEPAYWPEQYHDDPGCVECDYGERCCHCIDVDQARDILKKRYAE